jgi:hypothetical protein
MKSVCAWALAAAALIAAGPASATDTCNKQLFFISFDTGVVTWQKPRLDSPRDPNASRLAVHVLHQDGDDYVNAYSKCSGIEGKLVGQVRNLSFEFLNQSGEPSVHVGNGSPRYSVDLDIDGNGTYDFSAFLSGYYCNEPMVEDTRWSRADFTGRTAPGCTLQANNVDYSSDGTRSAWKVFADANPLAKVFGIGPAYLVMDEEGTAFVDRLAFHNIMYVASGTGTAAVKSCPSEASC